MSQILEEKLANKPKKEQELWALRHTAEHVLHTAMQNLYPHLKKAMGPATEDGFYNDFDLAEKISESDFPKIEGEMQRLIDLDLPMVQKIISPSDAKKLFADNPYKLEWIEDIEKRGEDVSVYSMGDADADLCSGPHVQSTGEIKAFTLLSVAGAYWHGDEKNKMLTRIYGTAFSSKKQLEDYLARIEEAKKRDHRKIGKALGLFTMNSEVGQGLTLWLPNGSIIRREIENYMVREQTKLGFQHVYSPHIGQKSLWEKSGHWELYQEKMYSPMDVDGVEYLVKPMTCPMHIQSFTFTPKSYRDLPYRIAEIASVYRYEQSGELSGLLRVRAFTQDDAHIFCTQEQTVDEFLSVFAFIQKLYKVFGFSDYHVRLGIRSKKEKYLGSDVLWEKAQEKIIEALKQSGAPYTISEGDAAFYGPKADFMIKDALGREWQCGTVQIDFMLPERFGLTYIDQHGQQQTPVMIHRAPLGSLERFIAILIEHYAGAFPTWLTPVQVQVLPIAQRHAEYAKTVVDTLKDKQIRAVLDDRSETLGSRIRDAQQQKVSYMLIIGDNEITNNTVTVRDRKGANAGELPLETVTSNIRKEIDEKIIT